LGNFVPSVYTLVQVFVKNYIETSAAVIRSLLPAATLQAGNGLMVHPMSILSEVEVILLLIYSLNKN
jgi:hypothetical protein